MKYGNLTDKVIAALEANGKAMSMEEIAAATKLSNKQAGNILYRLAEAKRISKRISVGGKPSYLAKPGKPFYEAVKPEKNANKDIVVSPAKYNGLVDGFTTVLADVETYRNALLQIRDILNTALVEGE